ncbi:MAG: DUF885 domain-containing protein [Chloroflexi bacterium]|nr:DUF885 domain-containing protein [Chloroflexota bacterium]MYK62085.1 DUF885 domain-containing protein [Chloroflexota bacterium]
MSKIFEIADGFVDTLAELNPIVATYLGVPGYDHLMPDYSPDGSQRSYDAERDVLKRIQTEPAKTLREQRCSETVQEEMSWSIDQHEAGLHYSGMNILHSPVQSLRQIFDLMPRSSTEDWENIASRMEGIGDSIASYQATLDEGIDRKVTASKRQTAGCIEQIETWVGKGDATPFFGGIADAGAESDEVDQALASRLSDAATSANVAYSKFAEYLRSGYLPKARERDAVGKEHYALTSRSYNGIDLNLNETYEWGWEQLRWVQSEMQKAADQIKPGSTIDEAVDVLESDPNRAIDGVDEFREWMQNLQDSTIADMDGTHFDIADDVRKIEAMIAPPGGALAMYYTGPSEDFSRPGRTWYPTGGKTSFPLWREVSIAYHEGVPGHHFQIATTMTLSDQLSRYQRLLAGTSGYVEGWALYAERLMHELGYLENPDYYMGMLDAQALRSVRVIIDIGMHLEKRIPDDSEFHPGKVWTPDLALEFMRDRVHFPPDFVASEIDRYLGIPGQAISYKVGERVWLESRQRARKAQGSSFDLKDWHNRALELGPMGLAQMQREMV